MVQMGDITIQDEAVILPIAVTATFGRDVSLTGNQVITGVGFRPRKIEFCGQINGLSGNFWGGVFNVGGTQFVTRDNHPETANSFQTTAARCINVATGGANECNATGVSMDEDGFTINWVKFNSPTGNISVHWIAYK